MKRVLNTLALFIVCTGFSQNETLFDQGKEQYKTGNFQEAITTWMKILDKDQHSSNLYFNLGNAHYKLNHIGPSVYYYEKALQLAPNDTDIKTNLAFAENARIDAIEPLPKTVFSKWYAAVANNFTHNGWAVLAIVFSILFVVLFLGYYFSALEGRKRLLFTTSILSMLCLFVTLGLAFSTYQDIENDKPAIVFTEEVDVKSEPNLGSQSAFVIHAGTKVQIIATDGNWFRIALEDGKDGWLPSSDVKQL